MKHGKEGLIRTQNDKCRPFSPPSKTRGQWNLTGPQRLTVTEKGPIKQFERRVSSWGKLWSTAEWTSCRWDHNAANSALEITASRTWRDMACQPRCLWDSSMWAVSWDQSVSAPLSLGIWTYRKFLLILSQSLPLQRRRKSWKLTESATLPQDGSSGIWRQVSSSSLSLPPLLSVTQVLCHCPEAML